MVYLLLKIIVCLLLAGILGTIIGWLLKRVFAKKHNAEQQRLFDVEHGQHKKELTQVESNWNTKYQSLNKTRNTIQNLLDTSTQKNTLLSQSVKTTQQTLNDQGEMLKRLQGDIGKLGDTKNELQNKNDLLAQEVVKLRNENKQIVMLEDNIIQLKNTQLSLEITLKETEVANETTQKAQLEKYHSLEKSDIVLKNKLKTATEKEQQKADELIIEKQQLLSIQQNEEKQQRKNNETIITLRGKLEKTAKNNTTLNNKITTLQQTATNITTLKEKSSTLEKDQQKPEETLKSTSIDAENIKQLKQNIDLLRTDNSILKKDNKDNDKKNTQLSNSLNSMTSNVARYKRYLIESEKKWATKIYELQSKTKATISQLNNEQKATHIAQQAVTSCKQKLTAIENGNTQLNKTLKILTEKNHHTEKLLSAVQQDYIKVSQKYKTLSLELEQRHKQKPKATAINKARADDLQKIKGIGKYNERILNKLGITHYAQIAHFTSQDEEKFGQELGVFATRISQEAWVGQAKILHQDKYGETISILHKDQK